MALITAEIESRPLHITPDDTITGEIFNINVGCQFDFTDYEGDQFDFQIRSDMTRFKADAESLLSMKSESFQSQYPTAIGTPVETGNTYVVEYYVANFATNRLKGYKAYLYPQDRISGGKWYDVISNTTDTLVLKKVTGETMPPDVDTVLLQNVASLRQNFQLYPQEGFYGTFFQYKVVRTIDPVGGIFDFNQVIFEGVRRNIPAEFYQGFNTNDAGWL